MENFILCSVSSIYDMHSDVCSETSSGLLILEGDEESSSLQQQEDKTKSMFDNKKREAT